MAAVVAGTAVGAVATATPNGGAVAAAVGVEAAWMHMALVAAAVAAAVFATAAASDVALRIQLLVLLLKRLRALLLVVLVLLLAPGRSVCPRVAALSGLEPLAVLLTLLARLFLLNETPRNTEYGQRTVWVCSPAWTCKGLHGTCATTARWATPNRLSGGLVLSWQELITQS